MSQSRKIILRNDTIANWTAANPTLSDGEVGFVSDVFKIKIGDGVTAFNNLDYYPLAAPAYTVSTVPAATDKIGVQILVTNESGGSVIAFSDGTNWRRVTDRAIIS